MNKYESIYNEAVKKNKRARWYDTAIMALATDLQQATGLTAKASGPFGLRAECPIYLNEGGGTGERKVIYITPNFESSPAGTRLTLYYDTGETTKTYAPGTMGDLNGFNNLSERLPDTLEDILPLLRSF